MDPSENDPAENDHLARTAKWLRIFADLCRDRSPLYRHLALSIADDSDILPLAVSPRRQPPHILLSAVQYLLFRDGDQELAKYYASLAERPKPASTAYPVFREFCFAHQEQLRDLVSRRLVQTNEVNRSTSLYLAFGLVSRLTCGQPLALVEIGTSAGLNLMLDRYAYRYSGGAPVGAADSTVVITCDLRGPNRPDVPSKMPEIAFRAGIDLNPIDLEDADETLWLRAMVWPEQTERARRLEHALQIARKHRPELIRGDARTELPAAVRSAPSGSPVCVFHTHMLHTWSSEDRDALTRILSDLANERNLFRVSTEWLQGDGPVVELTRWRSGATPETATLAHCDEKGRWLEWLGNPF